jgi:hypothetical protein
MGDTPSWLALVLGAVLMWMWLMIGAGVVALWRRDLMSETFTALFNCLAWPAGVVVQWVLAPLHRRRKERARQERLSAKVASGEYAEVHARNLGWKG